jgi:uncharacterized protein YdcH (DUF465 family)
MSAVDTDDEVGQLQSNAASGQVSDEHERLDRCLHELSDLYCLSPPEQLEEVTLKKRKLALKNRMVEFTRAPLINDTP